MKKRGRPRVEIDLNLAESLANLHCTIKEIAAVMNIPAATLQGRIDFRLIYAKGIESGKAKLRRIQYRLAEKSAAMAIFLGKNYLEQKDEQYLQGKGMQSNVVIQIIRPEANSADTNERIHIKRAHLAEED